MQDRYRQIDKTSCDARLDHTLGQSLLSCRHQTDIEALLMLASGKGAPASFSQ